MHVINKDRFYKQPNAVLFDTDNTLYPYNPAHQAASKAVRDKIVSTFSVSSRVSDNAYKEARAQVKARASWNCIISQQASSHATYVGNYGFGITSIIGFGFRANLLANLPLRMQSCLRMLKTY